MSAILEEGIGFGGSADSAVAPSVTPASLLTPAQQRLVELDLRKPEIKAYYEELETTLVAVAREVGVDGYFRAEDGTVFKIVRPEGQFVTYKQVDFLRTKREGEARGTLSMKEAQEAEKAGWFAYQQKYAEIRARQAAEAAEAAQAAQAAGGAGVGPTTTEGA